MTLCVGTVVRHLPGHERDAEDLERARRVVAEIDARLGLRALRQAPDRRGRVRAVPGDDAQRLAAIVAGGGT